MAFGEECECETTQVTIPKDVSMIILNVIIFIRHVRCNLVNSTHSCRPTKFYENFVDHTKNRTPI